MGAFAKNLKKKYYGSYGYSFSFKFYSFFVRLIYKYPKKLSYLKMARIEPA